MEEEKESRREEKRKGEGKLEKGIGKKRKRWKHEKKDRRVKRGKEKDGSMTRMEGER